MLSSPSEKSKKAAVLVHKKFKMFIIACGSLVYYPVGVEVSQSVMTGPYFGARLLKQGFFWYLLVSIPEYHI